MDSFTHIFSVSTRSWVACIVRRMAKLVVLSITLSCAFVASAQTDAQFTQYYEVPTFYNPAATGLSDEMRFRGGSRLQWVGIDNAPQTFLVTADMPFKFGKQRIGVGAYGDVESMGLYSSLNAGAQISYKLRKLGGEFSIGLTVGMYDQKFKGSEVFIPDNDDYHHSTDDAIPTRDIHGTALDLGLGIWYTRRSLWAGLSCTHLTSPTITMKSEGTESSSQSYNYEFQATRTLYLMAGGNIQVKNTLFELLPSLMVKSDFTFTTGEATLRARYNRFLLFGAGYRWQDAAYVTIGAELKNFYVGYAFDFPTSVLAGASAGSHEVFLGYSMKLDLSDKNKNRHKSIRIM